MFPSVTEQYGTRSIHRGVTVANHCCPAPTSFSRMRIAVRKDCVMPEASGILRLKSLDAGQERAGMASHKMSSGLMSVAIEARIKLRFAAVLVRLMSRIPDNNVRQRESADSFGLVVSAP